MSEEKYLVSVQKVTSMSGESVQVNFNLPFASSEEDITKEVLKVCNALEVRMVQQNEKVLALTQATQEAFESLGVETVNPNGKTH